ncbi:hypothetical protein ACFQ40_01125 [Kroppenstedtia eburnea]|uniref:hypothetical protein n=1 Tax=Kroppenstedtia eburnea TaxID=714067 RepID=UPI0036429E3E
MNKIEQFRQIVRELTAGEIEGIEVDITSASAVVTVHDALSEKNKERFLLEPAQVMIWIAFDLLEKAKEGNNGDK